MKTVVCVIDWHKTLVKGRTYIVRGARDANLGPPKDPERPDEILLRSMPKNPKGTQDWWYQRSYFKLAELKKGRK